MFRNEHGHSVVLGSVPHNATQTIREALRDAGVGFTFDHFTDIFSRKLRHWLVCGIHVVVPMRHPLKVFRTHKHMGSFDQVEPYYLNLFHIVHPFRPLYLPVDSPDRDRFIDRIDYTLGIKLQRDFGYVGDSGRWKETELNGREQKFVTDLMQEFEDVFDPLGYSPWHISGDR